MEDKEFDEMFDDQETGEDQEPEPKEAEGNQEEAREQESAPPAEDPDNQLKALQEQVEELKKINNGLLQAKTASSSKASKAQEELQAAKLQLQRYEESQKQQGPEKKESVDRLAVEFDDDGNPFIPASNIPVPDAIRQEVAALKQQLFETTNNLRKTQAQRDEAEALQNLLSQKDGYDEAFVKFQEQWNYVKDELFDQFVHANNLPVPRSQAEALDIATSPEFQKAFSAKYPGSDVAAVMEAGLMGDPKQSPYYLRKALDTLSRKKVDPSHKPLGDKPSSVSTMSDAGPPLGESDDLQQFADMDMEDFLKLTPAQESRLNVLLKQKGM
jgi:hypothetical protein